LKWADKAAQELQQEDTFRTRASLRSGSIDEQRWRRERARIVSTSAWNSWSSGNSDISVEEAKVVFRIDSYATGDLREAKITRLRSLFTSDKELAPFLDEVVEILNREASP
jgi:hypothetical protein